MSEKPFAVHANGRWQIARKVEASKYGRAMAPGKVWSEDDTTAFVCRVGEEDRAIALPEITAHPARDPDTLDMEEWLNAHP